MEEKKTIKLKVKPYNEDQQFTILGQPKELTPGIYGVKKAAVVGRIYAIPCPKCDHQIIVKAKSRGVFKTACPACKTPIVYKARTQEEIDSEAKKKEKTKPSEKKTVETERIRNRAEKLVNGKIVWGGLLSRKTFVLHEGENYIGRDDADMRSDVALKDEYVSRRSIKIEVIPGIKGNSFKLTVENATNPILVNGQSQAVGNSVYLNFGDTIVLGNTTLIFKEAKK